MCGQPIPTHFSEDFLGNVATKMLLSEMYWDGAVRKLKIDPKILQYVTLGAACLQFIAQRTSEVRTRWSSLCRLNLHGQAAARGNVLEDLSDRS